MTVPGGLTRKLPVLGVEPENLALADLRRKSEAFDLAPLWLWDRMGLDASKAARF